MKALVFTTFIVMFLTFFMGKNEVNGAIARKTF